MSGHKLKSAAVILAIVMAALACGVNLSSANIEDAWMAKDEPGDQRVTVFAPGDVFYCIVELKNAPDDTNVKATWSIVDVPGLDSNTLLDEAELDHGSGKLHFSLSSDQPWLPGRYKVDLHLNDELDRSLEFEVVGESAASPTQPPESAPAPTEPPADQSGAYVENAYMAPDKTGAEETDVFAPEDVFFLFIFMADAPDDTRVKAIWDTLEVDGQAPSEFPHEMSYTTGSGPFYFELSYEKLWPVGTYKVDIYVNDELDWTLEFHVEGAGSAAPAPASNLLRSAYTSRDDLGTEPTSIFSPNDVFYYIATLADGSQVSTLKASWYEVDSQGGQEIIDEVETTGGLDVYTFNLTNTEPWAVGKYKVELYLNGELAHIAEFEVQ